MDGREAEYARAQETYVPDPVFVRTEWAMLREDGSVARLLTTSSGDVARPGVQERMAHDWAREFKARPTWTLHRRPVQVGPWEPA